MAEAAGQPLVAIRELAVSFDGAPALQGVDLTIGRGETLGLVGESGSGKSVTWLAALGLLPSKARISGRVMFHGGTHAGGVDLRAIDEPALEKVRGGAIAMIFQDPASALNPVLTVGKQVREALALHRAMRGAAAEAEARRLFDLVGIPDAARRLKAYPHEFSGGQNQRVMIAMALAGRPELLIADEPTTALDVTIQAQILDLLASVRREFGMAMVLISHDLGVVSETCDRVAVMYAGRIMEEAPAAALFAGPRHPYAQGLLASLPPIEGVRRRLASIPGTVPDPRRLPPGCAFAPRCGFAVPACAATPPALRSIGDGRRVACILADADEVRAPAAKRSITELAAA
ncbi:MAG: ABC transporter ATP-binding protein [Beijerinckiaceae bacterium]